MRTKLIARNVALIVVFGVVGLTQFTENVRTVQILGLLASGAVIGSSLAMIIVALKAKQKTE
jgi:hypothetical protein